MEEMINNIAAAYIRVSKQEQEDKKYSWEAQEEKAREYAKSNNLSLMDNLIFRESRPASKVYDDNDTNDMDVIEKLQDRPEMQKILMLAQQGKIQHIIFYSRDRFARTLEDYIGMQAFFNKHKVAIHYTRPGEFKEDVNRTFDRFLEIILASVSELEANLLSVRTKAGSRLAVKKGYWPGGKAPLGFIKISEKVQGTSRKKLVSKLEAAADKGIINDVFNYYHFCGYGYKTIANTMKEKFPEMNWTKSKVEAIIKNQTYTGHIVWDRRGGRRRPGKHDGCEKSPFNKDASIIDENQWREVQLLRDRKVEVNDPKYYSTSFLLKGKLVCGICGQFMEARNYGKNKSKAYRCKNSNPKGVSELIVKKDIVEEMFLNELDKILSFNDNYLKELWQIYLNQVSKQQKDDALAIKDKEEKIRVLKEKIKSIEIILDKSIDIEIDNRFKRFHTVLCKYHEAYEEQKLEIEKRLNSTYTSFEDFKEALNLFKSDIARIKATSKRMLVDILVNRIFVYEDPESHGNITMDIVISPPKLSQ